MNLQNVVVEKVEKLELTPSCLEKRSRQRLRLELVSLDTSQISCIFCTMATGNPEGTDTLMRKHWCKVRSERKKSNCLLIRGTGANPEV